MTITNKIDLGYWLPRIALILFILLLLMTCGNCNAQTYQKKAYNDKETVTKTKDGIVVKSGYVKKEVARKSYTIGRKTVYRTSTGKKYTVVTTYTDKIKVNDTTYTKKR